MSKYLGALASGEPLDVGWTHRRTLPGGPSDDRVVVRHGIRVGRIVRDRSGRELGNWHWFGMWAGGTCSGTGGSFEECLAELQVHAPEGEPDLE